MRHGFRGPGGTPLVSKGISPKSAAAPMTHVGAKRRESSISERITLEPTYCFVRTNGSVNDEQPSTQFMAQKRLFYAWLGLALLTAGCQTIPQADVDSFGKGVTQAKQQTGLAFRSLNELARDSLIDHAAKQPTLNDRMFVAVIEPESVAHWERVFSGLESYAGHLIALTSPNLTKEYQEYAVKLAEEVKVTGEALKSANIIPNAPQVSAPLATSLVKIGDLLIRARAQSRAREVLRETDPEIQQLFASMADIIGSTRTNGLRGTAWSHWNQQKGALTPAFLEAQDTVQKRKVVEQFIELREKQLTHDAALASLERSLHALGNVHRAIAQGRNMDAASALALIMTELDDTKELHDEFKRALKPQD